MEKAVTRIFVFSALVVGLVLLVALEVSVGGAIGENVRYFHYMATALVRPQWGMMLLTIGGTVLLLCLGAVPLVIIYAMYRMTQQKKRKKKRKS